MVSYIGNNITPNGIGLIPPRKVIPGGYRSIIGNGSGLFSTLLSFSLANYTNASPRHIRNGTSLTGPFAANIPAIRVIDGNKYILIEDTYKCENYYSEELYYAAASKFGVDAISDSTLNPLGTVLGYNRIQENTSSVVHQCVTAGGVVGIPTPGHVYYSVFVKAQERDCFILTLEPDSVRTGYGFDLTNKTAASILAISDTTADPDDYGIIELDNGWFFCYIGMYYTSSIGALRIYLVKSLSEYFLYTGDPTKGLLYWGVNVVCREMMPNYIFSYASPIVKAKDVFIYPSANVPSWIRGSQNQAFTFNIIPNYSSVQFTADGNNRYLFSVDGTENIECYMNAADNKIKIDVDSVNKFTSTTKTWGMQDNIQIIVIPNDGANCKIISSGFASGNGEETGTIFSMQDSGDLAQGLRHTTEDLQLDGLMSEFRKGIV